MCTMYVAVCVLMSRSLSTNSYIACAFCVHTTTSHFMLLYKEVLVYWSKMLTLKSEQDGTGEPVSPFGTHYADTVKFFCTLALVNCWKYS